MSSDETVDSGRRNLLVASAAVGGVADGALDGFQLAFNATAIVANQRHALKGVGGAVVDHLARHRIELQIRRNVGLAVDLGDVLAAISRLKAVVRAERGTSVGRLGRDGVALVAGHVLQSSIITGEAVARWLRARAPGGTVGNGGSDVGGDDADVIVHAKTIDILDELGNVLCERLLFGRHRR